MVEQTVVHRPTVHGDKKERIIDMCNMDESQNDDAGWKKPDQKELTLCDSIYIKCQKMQANL